MPSTGFHNPNFGIQAVFFSLVIKLSKWLGLCKQLIRDGLFKRAFASKTMKASAFAGYKPTKKDVVVATFAKSGTNWMMQISQQIAWKGEAEFAHIHDVVPWPDVPGPISSLMLPLSDTTAAEQSPTRLRVIKTHLETDFVPYHPDAKYITVLRDPKEVLVSSYYFMCGLLGVLDSLTIDDWFDIFTAPDCSLATEWALHTASFWDWRGRPNVLVLTYSELKKTPQESIEKVATTMGVKLTETQLEKVLHRSSFAYMKEHDSQFAPPKLPLVKDKPVMVRSGKFGTTSESLTPAQQAKVDEICQAQLRRLGSDFPYASAFKVVKA